MFNAPIREALTFDDVLLSDFPGVKLEGFGALETDGANRWKWALGREQAMDVAARGTECRICYQLNLPREDSEVTILVNGRERARVTGRTTKLKTACIAMHSRGEKEKANGQESCRHDEAASARRASEPVPSRGAGAWSAWYQHHGILQGVQRQDAGS